MLDKLIALLKTAATTTTTETVDGWFQAETTAFVKLNGRAEEIHISADIPWAVIEEFIPEPVE